MRKTPMILGERVQLWFNHSLLGLSVALECGLRLLLNAA